MVRSHFSRASQAFRLWLQRASIPVGKIQQLLTNRCRSSYVNLRLQDLSHAEDEVTFYEEALALKRQPGVAGGDELLMR